MIKLLALGLLLPFSVFAQDLPPPSLDEIGQLLGSLGGLKGASALVIVGVVVQALMLVLRIPALKIADKYKLVAVALLSLVGGVVMLLKDGVPLGAALVHSSVLAAVQVFLHQIYKQFIEKKDPAPSTLN